MNFDYDLFVIGGGSGGVRAARVTAALDNKRVALAEMDRYGGTCVIRGCVPKKLMVFASEFASIFKESINIMLSSANLDESADFNASFLSFLF